MDERLQQAKEALVRRLTRLYFLRDMCGKEGLEGEILETEQTLYSLLDDLAGEEARR